MATDAVTQFFMGLADPDALARQQMGAAGMPVTGDYSAAQALYEAGIRKAQAEKYANPYDVGTSRDSRASLAAALQGMDRGVGISAAAGDRGMTRLGQQTGRQAAGGRSVAERVGVLRGGAEQGGEMAAQVGQGASEEFAQKQAVYGKGTAGMRQMDQGGMQAQAKSGIEQRAQMQQLEDTFTKALAVLETTKEGQKLDYDALMARISDEARRGSTETLVRLLQTVGTVAMMLIPGGQAVAGTALSAVVDGARTFVNPRNPTSEPIPYDYQMGAGVPQWTPADQAGLMQGVESILPDLPGAPAGSPRPPQYGNITGVRY